MIEDGGVLDLKVFGIEIMLFLFLCVLNLLKKYHSCLPARSLQCSQCRAYRVKAHFYDAGGTVSVLKGCPI